VFRLTGTGVSEQTSVPRRAPVIAAFIAGLVLVLAGMLAATSYLSSRSPAPIGTIGGSFHLEDQSGKPVTDQDLKGRPYLVFFGYTHCPDVCPTSLFEISEVFKALDKDADRAGALFITVDPERDTPAVLKEYLSNFDSHLRGLTGDTAAVAAALKAYRVYAKKVPLTGGDYTMDHTAVVYLMDKNGRFVAPFNLKQTPEAAAAQLRGYL
jgi:protein SCO1/2